MIPPRPSTVTPVSIRALAEALGAYVSPLGAPIPDDAAPAGSETLLGAVTGCVADNRLVRAGDLFVAVAGVHVHAARFAPAAIAAGAAAVLTDATGAETIGAADVPVLVVENPASILGEAAALVYGHPADSLTSFGVTGTNGKTTTAFMIDSILARLGRSTGLIGTVALRLAGNEIPAVLTTPQPADLQGMLAYLVEQGGTDLVMEASSHALAQGRTRPIRYSVAGFTNLTQDHLDFHNTLEEYFEAKKVLFAPENSASCVVLLDDEFGRALYDELAASRPGEVTGLAVYSELDGRAGWQYAEGTLTHSDGRQLPLTTDLPGDFNVANAALAAAMVAEVYPLADVAEAIAGGVTPVVPGRMEVMAKEPRVIVDFAHNEDALVKAMTSLRPSTEGRLVVLTGSAGDRDKLKRPLMAAAVAKYADHVIITDDDPHSEDPAQIRAELIAGLPEGCDFVEIGDRTEAIHAAILGADPADTILIAGRGHETIQEVAGVEIELDDRVVAREALKVRAK